MSDVLPPPPPPRGDSGCWKWGAIACGGGCALVVIVIVLIAVLAGPRIKKFAGSMMQIGQETITCQTEMTSLWNTIEQYHREKNKYPDKLDQLVPNYVASKAGLKFSLKPDGAEFTYHKPSKDAAPTDVVLEYKLSFTGPDGKIVPVPMRLMKNGQPEPNSFNYQYQNTGPGSAPSGSEPK
jgi:hypothetical protein